MPPLSNNLIIEYDDLFKRCNIISSRSAEVESIINKIVLNKGRYEAVGNPLGIPWYFIGVIHNMESGMSFSRHLHNGDPLTGKTKNVPAGRPVNGNPPFTWEESASDSLQYQKLDKWSDWSLPGLLFKIEEYNGWGYRIKHPHVLSPYLWSFSNHYTKGKYIADGTWSETASSKQCGAAVILRRMAEKGLINFNAVPIRPRPAFVPAKPISRSKEPYLKFSNKEIEYGKELQAFLNKFPGIFVKEDGAPGEKTSNAFKKVFGFYLKGDPRK